MLCIEMKTNEFYQYKIGTIIDIELAKGFYDK